MNERQKRQSLTSTALNLGGKEAVRSLSLLHSEEAVSTLIHVKTPGALQLTLEALRPTQEERSAGKNDETADAVEGRNTLQTTRRELHSVTEELVGTLPHELQACSEPSCDFVFRTSPAIMIKGCLKHAYHPACGASHEDICGE